MANDYMADEGTRRSAMAAQSRESIHEVHQSTRLRSSQEFDRNSFSSNVGNIETVVEGLCVHGAKGWEEASRLQSDSLRLSARLFEGPSVPPVLRGHDRATLSLYDPIQNLGEMCDSFYSQVNAWATKATYFKEVSSPLIVRTIDASTSEAGTAKMIREALEYVGPIDRHYVRSFNAFALSMVDPITELRALERFIASILEEGDEIPVDDSEQEKTATTAIPRGGVSRGFKELLAFARYADSTHEEPSSQQEEHPKHKSARILQNPGSPSYLPPDSAPSFPVDAVTLPALALALPWLTLDETSREPGSSSLLQRPSTFYDTTPDTAPPGTPQWKKDLSERKGHRIRLLHVDDLELDILAKCLSFLYNATAKAEECLRFILGKKELAKQMKEEYEQWAGSCEYLEAKFKKTGKGEKGGKKGGGRIDHGDGNDANERKRRLRAKAPLSGTRHQTDTLDSDAAREHGPQDDVDASGHRQIQIAAQSSPPSPHKQQQPRRRPSVIDLENHGLDPQSESESAAPSPTRDPSPPLSSAEEETTVGAPRDFGMGSSSPEGEGSEDSESTIRTVVRVSLRSEGRGFGSPVPSGDDDDDEEEGDEGDGDGEDAESTVGTREGGSVAGDERGESADEQAGGLGRGREGHERGHGGGGRFTAAEDEGQGGNDNDNDNDDADEQADGRRANEAEAKKSLIERGGRRVGVYGEEL